MNLPPGVCKQEKFYHNQRPNAKPPAASACKPHGEALQCGWRAGPAFSKGAGRPGDGGELKRSLFFLTVLFLVTVNKIRDEEDPPR